MTTPDNKTPAPAKPAAKSQARPAAAKSPVPKSPPRKAAARAPAKGTKATAAKPVATKTAATKVAKPKKIKMVRDSFTMPKPEFAVLDALKARALALKAHVKKTELIRAGIKALAAMPDAAFVSAVRAVPSLKTGRPAKSE